MYQYQFGGKQGITYSLIESSDLVVVRTKDASDLKNLALSTNARALVPKLLPVTSFPEANVTVYKCIDKSVGGMKLRNQVRKNFSKEAAIRFAGRVLKDSKTNEPVIYTENFFVKFNDDITTSRCEQILEEANLGIKEQLLFAENAYFAQAAEGTGLKIFDIAAQLLSLPEVECCHPELVRQKKHRAIFSEQWYLKPLEIGNTLINQHIEAALAWQQTKGDGITIAIIDDGVDQNHEEFVGKIVAPIDTILNQEDGNPKRPSENHGTACAGIACAAGNHGASGVAPQAALMPIRSGGLGSLAEAKAFWWAAEYGADVISCSWGPMDGPWWDSEDPRHFIPFPLPDSTRMAIDHAIEKGRGGKGCIITWAAGNGNESVDLDGYASYDKVIAVAASNDRGERSYYSDYGQAIWCCFPSSDVDSGFVPVPRPQPLTPGIWTTDRSGQVGYNAGRKSRGDIKGNYTNDFGGTSASCPGVAGVVALMLGVNPALNWQEVKAIIKHSCDKIDEEFGNYDTNGHSPFYGYGKINAAKAVTNALEAASTTVSFKVIGQGIFSKVGELPLPMTTTVEGNRLLGIILQLAPFHSQLEIEYLTVINKLGPSGWMPSEVYSGTRDRRRKMIGFAIRLKGDLADSYDVVYKAKLRKKTIWVEAANGAICGTDENGGAAIESISIDIKHIID